MNLHFDASYLITGFLIFLRLSAVFLFTPLLSAFQIPTQIRILFVFALSFVLLMGLNVVPVPQTTTVAMLVMMSIVELTIGAMLAFGVLAAFAAFQLGGRIVDTQIGFGIASLIDPISRGDTSLLGTLLHSVAVLIFFAIDGHHMVMRGLAYTLFHIPPGSMAFDLDIVPMVAQFGLMFALGFSVVVPVIVVLLLLDIGMAVFSRSMPQVNFFIIGMPVKLLVGLITLALSMPYMGGVLQRIYASIFRYWEQMVV